MTRHHTYLDQQVLTWFFSTLWRLWLKTDPLIPLAFPTRRWRWGHELDFAAVCESHWWGESNVPLLAPPLHLQLDLSSLSHYFFLSLSISLCCFTAQLLSSRSVHSASRRHDVPHHSVQREGRKRWISVLLFWLCFFFFFFFFFPFIF